MKQSALIASTHTDEEYYTHSEVLIIGSGIAGLFTAIQVSEHKNVLLITKDALLESNTRYAQGGIAAVISSEDSRDSHRQDTLLAGAGLCEYSAVNILVNEAPECVQKLIDLGTSFDSVNGELQLTQEGAHSYRRILHANGDSTGYEIVNALAEQVNNHPRIQVWEHHVTTKLWMEEGRCAGATILRPDGTTIWVRADNTIVCTGGWGQLYEHTTNPEVATGDGVALAYRAGAVLRDMEFVQFHPTALYYPGAPCFLISEAVRGEGAVLRNHQGTAFMANYHPLHDLAPRDIVARAMIDEMEHEQTPFVYLDITHKSEEDLKERFPTIYETCLQYGLNLAYDWIPVAPAAHYMMGGIQIDEHGASSIPHLYACGEVSSTGIHGANRLASNSLSEALVYGQRIAKAIQKHQSISLSNFSAISDLENVNKFTNTNDSAESVSFSTELVISPTIAELRKKLNYCMKIHAGIRRSAESIHEGIEKLQKIERSLLQLNAEMNQLSIIDYKNELELRNMLLISRLILEAALYREESRGGHYREDFPNRNDDIWQKHTIQHIHHKLMEAYQYDI